MNYLWYHNFGCCGRLVTSFVPSFLTLLALYRTALYGEGSSNIFKGLFRIATSVVAAARSESPPLLFPFATLL